MSADVERDEPVERPSNAGEVEQESPTERVPSQVQAQTATLDAVDEKRDRAARAERAENAEHSETPYLPEQTSGPANERWQRIQSTFVDDPRKSVTEAHQLVGELTQRIVDAFAQERDALERQWSKGADVSTEDLRVSLQRYRAFFSRLLPSVKQLTADKPIAAE